MSRRTPQTLDECDKKNGNEKKRCIENKKCDNVCNSMSESRKHQEAKLQSPYTKRECKAGCERKYTNQAPFNNPEAIARAENALKEAVRQDNKRNKARNEGRKRDKKAQKKEEKLEQNRRKKAQQNAERNERAARRDRENDKRVGGITVGNLGAKRQRGGGSNNAVYDARKRDGGRNRSSAVYNQTAPGLIEKCKTCMSSRCYYEKTDKKKKKCKNQACKKDCTGVSDADVGLDYISREYPKLRF